METSEIILREFKKLVAAKLYDKITVADICEEAKISRKTFYTHYLDKNAVLEKIINEDTVHPINEMRRLLRSESMKSATRLIVEMMHRNLFDNRVFYESLFAHGGETVFVALISSTITDLNSLILARRYLGMSEKEREYMAYFFAVSHAMLIRKWIRNGFDVSPNQLAQFFDTWALRYWADIDHAKNIPSKTIGAAY